MANPVSTTRSSPTGKKLENGFPAKIAFNRDADLNLWEMDVGQPNLTVGDPIDTTTQHNTDFRTRSPRKLKDMEPFTFTFAYDPIVRQEAFNNLLGQNGSITEHYPDGSKMDFWGYLQSIDFDPMVEGTMPTGTATVVPTNWDNVNDVEAGPVLTLVAGT